MSQRHRDNRGCTASFTLNIHVLITKQQWYICDSSAAIHTHLCFEAVCNYKSTNLQLIQN